MWPLPPTHAALEAKDVFQTGRDFSDFEPDCLSTSPWPIHRNFPIKPSGLLSSSRIFAPAILTATCQMQPLSHQSFDIRRIFVLCVFQNRHHCLCCPKSHHWHQTHHWRAGTSDPTVHTHVYRPHYFYWGSSQLRHRISVHIGGIDLFAVRSAVDSMAYHSSLSKSRIANWYPRRQLR